jgi:hypothetical protein
MSRTAAADLVARRAERAASPPPVLSPPVQAASVIRRNADLTEVQARRLDRVVQEIADQKGWRRGNVGDVLVTLVDLLLDDAELQRRVAAAVPVPKRVKYVRYQDECK